jgi:hypothetical protein
MAEFQWWLLLVGLVAGGGLVAVVLLDGNRREQDIEARELPAEAEWIASRLASTGRVLEVEDVEAVLREHREYKALPPPDLLEPIGDEDLRPEDRPAARPVEPPAAAGEAPSIREL